MKLLRGKAWRNNDNSTHLILKTWHIKIKINNRQVQSPRSNAEQSAFRHVARPPGRCASQKRTHPGSQQSWNPLRLPQGTAGSALSRASHRQWTPYRNSSHIGGKPFPQVCSSLLSWYLPLVAITKSGLGIFLGTNRKYLWGEVQDPTHI